MARRPFRLPRRTLPLLLALALAGAVPRFAPAQDWRGPVALEVIVEDARGRDIAGAEVRLVYLDPEGGGQLPSVLTDAGGKATIGGLAAGRWVVEVRHTGQMTYRAEIAISADNRPEVLSAAHEMAPGATSTLKVKLNRGRAGAPPPAARVAAAPVVTPPAPAPPPAVAQPAPVAPAVAPPKPASPAPASPAPASPAPASPAPAAPAPAAPAAPVTPPTAKPAVEPAPQPAPAPVPPATPPAASAPAPQPATPPTAAAPAPQPVVPPAASAPAPKPSVPPVESAPAPKPAAPPTTPAPTTAPPPKPVVPEAPPAAQPATASEPKPPAPPAPTPTNVPPAVAAPKPALAPVVTPAPPAAPAPTVAPAAPAAAPAVAAAPVASTTAPARQRVCVECAPGEKANWGEASIVGGASAGCPADFRQRLESVALAGADIDALAGEAGAGCRAIRVDLPAGTRFTGFRYEASSRGVVADCLPGRECPAGAARFPFEPVIRKENGRTTLLVAFESTAADWRNALVAGYWSLARK